MNQVDLRKLAVERTPEGIKAKTPRRRRWVSRYVIPAVILVGFLGLLAAAAGRQWLPKSKVSLVPVIVKRGEIQTSGTPLFQAAGWIEPRPTSVSVAALAPGVVEELLVVEGQQISQGEPIARLIAIDAELGVEQAQIALAIRDSELQRARAEQSAAMLRLDKPVHLLAALADAQSLLAKATTEQGKIPFLVDVAKAKLEFTRSSLAGKQAAKAAIAGVIVGKAAKEHAMAAAELDELLQRGPNLKREVAALQAKKDVIQDQLESLVEERRRVDEAKANVATALALRDEAELNLRQAELVLQRCVVRAPISGRILRLVALPGSQVMGIAAKGGHNSSTVAEMYDPNRLQVRADVRLENIPFVVPGAPVEITTASSAKVMQGRVLQTTSSANVQKNTLEVKVEILSPPPTVRPEMLVTSTFLAPETRSTATERTEAERIFVPQQLVRSSNQGAFVWTVDPDNRATKIPVTTGTTGNDGQVEILQGLNATSKLIATGAEKLDEGDTVAVARD